MSNQKDEEYEVCFRGNWAPSLPRARHYSGNEFSPKKTPQPRLKRISVKAHRAMPSKVKTGANSSVSDMAKLFAGKQLYNVALNSSPAKAKKKVEEDINMIQMAEIDAMKPLEEDVVDLIVPLEEAAPKPMPQPKPQPKPEPKTNAGRLGALGAQSFREQRLREEQMFNSPKSALHRRQKQQQRPMRNVETSGYNAFAGLDNLAHPGFRSEAAPAPRSPAYNPFASHQLQQPAAQPPVQQRYYQPPSAPYGFPNAPAPAPAPAPMPAFDLDDLWKPAAKTSAAPAAAPAPAPAAPAAAAPVNFDDLFSGTVFGTAPADTVKDPAPEPAAGDAKPIIRNLSSQIVTKPVLVRQMSDNVRKAVENSNNRKSKQLTKDLQELVDAGALSREQALAMMPTETAASAPVPVTPVEAEADPPIRSQTSKLNEQFNTNLRTMYNDPRRHADLALALMDPVPKDMGELRLFVCKMPGANEVFTLSLTEGMVPLCTAVLGDTDSKVKVKFHKHMKPDLFVTLHGARRVEGKPAKLLGRVKGNLMRSEFTIYNGGLSSKKAKGKMDVRQELGAVLYQIQKNKMRHMEVITPVLDADTTRATQFRPMYKKETMVSLYKAGQKHNMLVQTNRHPRWDPDRNCLVMNFGKRVKLPSVKNFILEDKMGNKTLLFGRVGDDQFNLDVSYPMSIFQGFCIALSSIYARHG